jgi:hypothetical protein
MTARPKIGIANQISNEALADGTLRVGLTRDVL